VDQNDSFGLTPAAFNPLTDSLSGSNPFNAGLELLYSRIGGTDFEVLLHALEERGDVNILSAPRILTQNNQEAAILVGEKFPIIESENNAGGSVSTVTSTSLSYYENIGIQLNVIPQVCADEYINMIVHPTVSSIDGFETGIVSTGGDTATGTRYPVLKVREAQTQILLKSEETVAIGGLQNEVNEESRYGVPLLMDIPFLGRLFRRDTTNTKKIDLLIMIKATIVDNDPYVEQSRQLQQQKLEAMGMEIQEDPQEVIDPELVEPVVIPETEEIEEIEAVLEEEALVAEEEALVAEEEAAVAEEETVIAEEEIMVAEEVAVEEEAVANEVDNEEILALVNSMDEPTTEDETDNADM
jgi:type II secretory pathway component GspD/PulD (secretin)